MPKKKIRYGSVCSGIEAATVAWHPLGWIAEFFSEIEKFPCDVLADRWPKVKNLGDMTKFKRWKHGAIDVLVGGTPCQSFSVAGLRKGLADPRGNLALTFLAIADRTRPKWVVWENVPGVFSSVSHAAEVPVPPPPPVDLEREGQEVETDDEYDAVESHAFGCFLAGLSELGYGGAYRVLDAQHFGVPQRRRRVFVVGYLGDWRRAAAVLLERHGLQGNPPPSRETGQRTARPIAAGSPSSGGVRNDADTADNLIETAKALRARPNSSHREDADTYVADVAPSLTKSPSSHSSPNVGSGQGTVVGTITARMGSNPMGAPEVDGGMYMPWPAEVAPTLNAHFGDKQGLEDQHALNGAGLFIPVTLPLKGEGHDASEDGTGRGVPLIVPPLKAKHNAGDDGTGRGTQIIPIQEVGKREGVAKTPSPDDKGRLRLRNPGVGVGKEGDPSYTLQAGAQHGIAVPPDPMVFTEQSHNQEAVPTITSSGDRGRNAMNHPCVAIRDDATPKSSKDVAFSLTQPSPSGGGHPQSVMKGMQVRRLTPRECERLQGFPDDYTLIKRGKKWAADGPRYKALGNSMAVPVMRWIGERIAMVEDLP